VQRDLSLAFRRRSRIRISATRIAIATSAIGSSRTRSV
jgi:hypothetical protein